MNPKSKSDAASQSKAPAPKPLPPPSAPPEPSNVPPLFRRNDWFTFFLAFGIVWIVYFLTLAPQVTLEDSGELTTASYYAGIPHPPGYPFWTIYTWLWTVLVPFHNIAWRVQLAEASTAAMACGVLAFMVSRGSSMLMEGIDELKGLTGKWENAICLVSGVTAGLLLGFGSSMWKESVVINRISLFGVPWLMLVLLCMMRWIYAPHQMRYLYLAMVCFGICATIHQTLTVAGLGLEIGVALCRPKLGRDLFLANSILFILTLFLKGAHIVTGFDAANPMLFNIFCAIGIGSVIACICLAIQTGGLFTEILPVIFMGLLWFVGASFYFWEPIAGMTNPPMEWGYPRTVEGFWHALTRGQYDKVSPTDIFHDPKRFFIEVGMLVQGVADAFTWVYMFFAALPLLFFFKMKKRERAWIGLVFGLYPFLGVLLTIFLSPTPDRQMADLVKVFFIASHSLVALMIGYGIALTAAYMATHYEKFRLWGLAGGGVAILLAFYNLFDGTNKHFLGLDGAMTLGELPHWIAQAFAKDQFGLPVFANLILVASVIIFVLAVAIYRHRAPLFITLALFASMPLTASLSHWFHSEQHNHWFGYWFGHDMFTPPFVGADGKLTYDPSQREAAAKGPNATMVYPEMARDAVLFGGTDPGRFCPTYMIFCESFIPHRCQPKQDQNFDRRDVYIITQNALADGTYLDYIRAQFNRHTQVDPPFFQNFLSGTFPTIFHGPTRWLEWLDDIFETIGGKVEYRRRTETSWFKREDFTNLQDLASKLRKGEHQDALSKFLYTKLTPETQSALDHGRGDEAVLGRDLANDFNTILKGDTIYDAERFKGIKLPPLIVRAESEINIPAIVVRLNRRLLEEAYPTDIAKSLGGVYPDTEISTPSPEDSSECFNEYIGDAQRRLEHDNQYPNEPRQVKPGEDVRIENGRVSVSGQVAVMAINGLLTKVIFDKNPEHEFYVEESFPLDWMYPYLTPFSVIMKINRHPLPEITQDIVDKDHAFWSHFSERTIGNWITYDTSIKDICQWADNVYLRHNFAGFTGDRAFVRDDDAQKAFSKLRSSIGASIYQWRIGNSHSPAESARMTREAEFALKQSFAFCPYSPEAVFHLLNLLLSANRIDDSLLILKTCHNLDPYNDQINGWIERLESSKNPSSSQAQADRVNQFFAGVQRAIDAKQNATAVQMLDQAVSNAGADPSVLIHAADMYLRVGEMAKSEQAIKKLTVLTPTVSEPWYNLAVIQSYGGQTADAVASIKKAFELNAAELKANPQMYNLREHFDKDPNFARLRESPEFKAALPQKP